MVAEYKGGSSGTTHFVHPDHLGSTRLVTNLSGGVVECDDYQPFSEQLSYTTCSNTGDTSHKFTGKERDSESGLDNFGARYDSSQYGRFMTPDPLLNSGLPNNPQTWNRYAYALNDPLIIVDPTGLYNLQDECEVDNNKCLQQAQNLKNAIAALTDAVNKLKDGDQKTALQNALTAFGTENDGNNVQVRFGTNADGAAGHTDLSVDSAGTNLTFTVTFDPSQNQGMLKQAIDAAHEGTHIADISDPRFAAGKLSDFSGEYRAYRTSAWAASALGASSLSFGRNNQYPIWNRSWGAVDDKVLTRFITDTYKYPNGQHYQETSPHGRWAN